MWNSWTSVKIENFACVLNVLFLCLSAFIFTLGCLSKCLSRITKYWSHKAMLCNVHNVPQQNISKQSKIVFTWSSRQRNCTERLKFICIINWPMPTHFRNTFLDKSLKSNIILTIFYISRWNCIATILNIIKYKPCQCPPIIIILNY